MHYTVSLFVRVFDEAALLRVATAHAQRLENTSAVSIEEPSDALRMLLDPGGGDAAYRGNFCEAGFEIIESSAE